MIPTPAAPERSAAPAAESKPSPQRPASPSSGPFRRVAAYAAIARPDHWFKNVFMALGVLLACFYHPDLNNAHSALAILWAVAATCLIASSNYVLNEILDAPTDRSHPTKRHRPIPSGLVALPIALLRPRKERTTWVSPDRGLR